MTPNHVFDKAMTDPPTQPVKLFPDWMKGGGIFNKAFLPGTEDRPESVTTTKQTTASATMNNLNPLVRNGARALAVSLTPAFLTSAGSSIRPRP